MLTREYFGRLLSSAICEKKFIFKRYKNTWNTIMKHVLLLLLFWKPYLTYGYSYQDYYNEDFYSFIVHTSAIHHNSLVQELFRNLTTDNSTDNCIRDLKYYRDSIYNHETWAISLLDSSGFPVTGRLTGNTISLGNYKQCLSTSPKNFSSSYCLAHINISKKPNLPWVPHNVPIVFTLCVPDSCSYKQLETLLESSASVYNATVTVECQSRRPGFTFGDVFTMLIYISIWIVIISTTMPKKWIPINSEVFHQIWDSFCLKRNLSNMLKTNTRCTLLSSLHGLRVLSQCMIVWYHIVLSEMIVNYPVLNKFSYNEFLRSWRGAIETELVLAVDTFFVIGGILLTWNCLEKKRKFNLISYYTHRYLRLTPPYLATLLVISTFANKLCDGPLCVYLIDKEKQSCASYWWTNVLYINNLYPGIFKSCMPHSWYLAADWQLFFFLSPLVVIVINKWPHHLFKLISAIFLTSVISTFLVSYLYHLPTENLMFNSYEEADHYYNKLYGTPYARAGPWAVGMFCGVILHNFTNNPIKLSKKTHLMAWVLTVLGLCLSVELDLPFLKLQNNEAGVWSALFNAIQRNVWAVSICWIIFSSGTQKAGIIGKFLSWPVFQPLAKLSYSAYLIHKLIISLYFGETYGYSYISATTQIPLVLGITFLTYAVALLLYLSFEAPTAHLDNIIFQKGNQTRKGTGGNDSTPEITTKNRNSTQDSELSNEK
ncbi:nose resistant to fluoxetine protein 6-like isoform X2 [Halyomorpha halys]|uniref:nose resistant to fluoxetine protein 6-like isoform X2 n=1 Tax=Halyomorpha halys TaxID=286706 RepID=UPI0006D4EA6B